MPLTNRTVSDTSCWACSKRRVRCDSTKPYCQRCTEDSIICPGYTKPLQWMNRPSRPRNTKQSTAVVPAPVSQQLMSPADNSNRFLARIIIAWNSEILPCALPAHRPFSRSELQVAVRPGLPSVLQNLLIVTMLTVQSHKHGRVPLENQDLCHYRGVALRELGQLVPKTEMVEVVFAAIAMAVIVDFTLCHYEAWNYHLDAARKLIQSQGGLDICLRKFPSVAHMLHHGLLTLDVLSATVADTDSLAPATIEIYSRYIPLLPHLEEPLITKTKTCPQMMMQCIIRITALRIDREIDPETSVSAIRHTIEDFDHTAWARRVANYRLVRPHREGAEACEQTVAAWSIHACCYTAATLIYLLLSTPAENGHDGELSRVTSVLWINLRSMFDLATTDVNADVTGQLWKFVGWPILMGLRVAVEIDCDKALQSQAIDMLQRVASTTGDRSCLGLGHYLLLRRLSKH